MDKDRLQTIVTVIPRWGLRDQVSTNKLGQRRAMVGVLPLQHTGEDHLAHHQHLVTEDSLRPVHHQHLFMVDSLRLARRPIRRDLQDRLLLVHHPTPGASIGNRHLEVVRLEATEDNHLAYLRQRASMLDKGLTLTLEATNIVVVNPLPELTRDEACEPSRLHPQCRKFPPIKASSVKR